MAARLERRRGRSDEQLRRQRSELEEQWSAADRSHHRARVRLHPRLSADEARRRVEDRIREELRDSRAVTITATKTRKSSNR
jgi:hypothetical protein